MNLSVPLTVCTYTYSLIWLHPDTFEPEHLFPQPATHVLSTTLRSCLAPQSLLLLYTHPHENQGSWTPTSRGSVITEWIDCVCVLNVKGDYVGLTLCVWHTNSHQHNTACL